MNTIRRTLWALVALAVLATQATAQTALNSTTLSAALSTTSGQQVSLTSTANISVGDLLVVDREAMLVQQLTPDVRVTRGYGGTLAVPHVSGSLVYSGSATRFYSSVPKAGACTRTSERYLPRVVLPAGDVWDCPTGAQQWTLLNDFTTLTAKSVWFNIDNGAGTTIDDVILRPARPIVVTAARIVYVDATAGTVAAGNARVGTTVGGSEVVASTAYTNSATVGSTTAMTVVNGFIPAGTAVYVRHTGIAVTVAGQAYVEIDYHYR